MRRVRGMALCRRVGGKGDGSMLHYRRAEGKIIKCGALVKREITVVCRVMKMAITARWVVDLAPRPSVTTADCTFAIVSIGAIER